ncbi:hypothetical protein ISN76_13035 [Dyella halodurans]|uniref:Uncharacterized protein n=1 Tax=Dyella halodurans TaxID=1920171 RepID=A0ABV9C0F5_9GAMM|nr:hypothetical protein [Dyella halodurans]
MSDLLTAPERATERDQAKRVRAQIYRLGGCGACKHAVHGWGKSACNTIGRTFPRCMSTPGIGFELDPDQLKGNTNACR